MLHIHRAERADALADALAGLLSDPLSDPFAPEVVSVPTRGMERWLTQRMSATLGARPGRLDGVCANVEFPTPHRLAVDAVAAASGIDPDGDPWLPERAVWPLLDVVEETIGEPWLASLAVYLGGHGDSPDPLRRARRLTVLRHLSLLYHRYALHRPGMLGAWGAGDDVDAGGAPLAPGCAWQAPLWRRLRARIGLPDLAERAGAACLRLAGEPELLDLPQRLALFGLTRIPAGHVEILRALAVGRDVHLFLLHPSPGLWQAVGAAPAAAPGGDPPGASTPLRRADDPTAELGANRLLSSWGRDAREMQLVLMAGGEVVDHHHGLIAADHAETLLRRVQEDIRQDRRPPGAPLPGAQDERASLESADRSLEIHLCHGRARQVEVVRDAVLHALAEDPTLEPRDVIVMCPDIESFAPLIQATFGAGELPDDDGRDGSEIDGTGAPAPVDLRVRLADRSLRQTNPVLGVVSALLELAEGRLTASDLLDLADRAPVRRRFRLDDDDLTRIQDWIAQAGIRWGLDAAHRAPYRLESVNHGTWRAGLDRLLLGVTMTEDDDRLYGGVLPLDDVDSRSIDVAGRLGELIERTGRALGALGASQPMGEWAQAIAEAADLLTATSEPDRWQRAELGRILDEMTAEAGETAGAALAPAEIRALLSDRLAGRPTRANFRTGHLTVCTLHPMRSVPHRVVCLLGLDDGAFPRRSPRDGDDLMLADPLVGERDPRSEDRQLLLDALMAAQERLIVTYTGNDERTNAPRPPAVPVGELLDTIDATVRVASGTARQRVLIRHPLQPFNPRNFVADGITDGAPWSFDAVALSGAQALANPDIREPPPPFLSAPLPPRRDAILELSDLVRFLEHPARAFLRQRLGISLRLDADEVQDALAVELGGLERWAVGQRLLEARLRGIDGRTACLAEIARGSLPPGALGQPVIERLYRIVDAIVAQAQTISAGTAGGDPADVRVPIGGGRILSGTVPGVSADTLLITTFSRVSARHRLGAWARLLALTATCPERAFSAATVGRGSGADDVRVARIEPLAPDAPGRREHATEQLAVLVDLYDRGMREPVPLACLTSEAYAVAARAGQDPILAAAGSWETEWQFDREDRDLEHQLVLGGVVPFRHLLELPGLSEDPDWEAAEDPSRFGRYARRLWDGLLDAEMVTAR